MDFELQYENLTEAGIKKVLEILVIKGKTFCSKEYTDKAEFIDNEFFCEETFSVEGEDFEDYVPECGPSYSSGGQPAEGGYFNSVVIDYNGKDMSELFKDSVIEDIRERLSEQKMGA
jgi:hypothetical protein